VKVRLNDSDLVGTGVEVGRSSLFRSGGDDGGMTVVVVMMMVVVG
jgi:hypothetical protein